MFGKRSIAAAVAVVFTFLMLGGTRASLVRAEGAATVDSMRILKSDAEPQNWLSYGRDYDEQRFSPLKRINSDNIGKLGLAWSYQFDTDRGQEATPVVVDGVLFTTTAWSKVFAFDAATGRLRWAFNPHVRGRKGYDACCDVGNRGVAVWKGKVYVGVLDGRLIALDANTGKKIWTARTVDPAKPYTITGAPRVVKDKVLIGNGGSEFGVRGYVSAYDAKTGKLAWRFFMVPNPEGRADGEASDAILQKLANATWGANGAWKQVGGGGSPWDVIVYDAALSQVLVGTGNGTPWNHRIRSGDNGDNLFLSSIVALDPDSGTYKWHYQETPAESWDFDAAQPIILAELKLDGQDRQVMMQASKNGYFFVIDRHTGKPISVQNFVPVNWADGYDTQTWRPKVRPEANYDVNGSDWLALPSAFGAHNWHPMAYSPKTGLVYIPTQLVPFGYADDRHFEYAPGRWNLGDASVALLGPRTPAGLAALKAMSKGELVAWDPVKQAAIWRVPHDLPSNGGVLATAGDLVFQGTPGGELAAYRSDTGAKLWSFNSPNGIIAAPITYAVAGEQYIAVMAGYGGSAGLSSPFSAHTTSAPNGRLLVFKLGATAKLPPTRLVRLPANPPVMNWPAEVEDRGEALYAANCSLCHGPSTYSAGVLPDLRRSPALADVSTWNAIVLKGALEARGMINFSLWLKPEEVDAIRAFVAKQARVLKHEEASNTSVSSNLHGSQRPPNATRE
jgi:quinohemoprotein ethanol dehydrogenase